MRPARPASSPILRGRRISPDTLMLRQPETAGPAGPLALQKRDTFRTAPVFRFSAGPFPGVQGNRVRGALDFYRSVLQLF